MTSSTLPSTGRVWQYSKTSGGIEKHLKLNTLPIPTPKPNQHLIRVLAVGVNPVDFKLTEIFPIGAIAVSKPATPGIDIAGELVVPASGSKLAPGTLVYGASGGGLLAGGGFAEYVVTPPENVVPIAEGVSPADAASLPVAAVTACQSIAANTKPGDRILYLGGSGGVGLIAIQVAKALGCHITVTCSTRNVELCRSYGADDVQDYTAAPLLSTLLALGKDEKHRFDLVIDGVGNDHSLYWACDRFTTPGAKWLYIAMSPGLKDLRLMLGANLLPLWLGGQSRKLVPMSAEMKAGDLEKVMAWAGEGKVRACIDSRFKMEDAPEAIAKVRSGRARGKVIIDVVPA